MILVLLGIIIGLLIAMLCGLFVIMFRTQINAEIERSKQLIDTKTNKNRGFILELEDEIEEERQEIIEKNRKEGKDTHISELL